MVTDAKCLLGESKYTAAEPRHVSVARRWVCDLLSGRADEETLRDVALCAGELADNARKHGRTDGEFSVAVYLRDDILRIQVTNDAVGVTVPHVTGNRFTEEGHGLQIVSNVAKCWDSYGTTDGKQVVWCDLGIDPVFADSCDRVH